MSSLFGALTVAVGGLTAQSDAIGNISDDLSNAQTTGFKSIGTVFQSLVTDSSATVNDPGGVKSLPSYQNNLQGNLVQSGTPTSLAVTGSGFFPVESASINASGATNFTGNILFTRQGDFTLNSSGFLVNSSGYYLLGYSVSASGNVDKSTTAPIQLSQLLDKPVATSNANYNANLPAGVTAGSFTSTPSTIQIFDAEGTQHEMSLTWTKTGTNAWTLALDVAKGVSASSDYTATIPITFNSASNAGTISGIGTGTGTYTHSTATAGSPATISFTLNFPGASAQNVTLGLGDYDAANGVTQFADSSNQVSVSSFQQNGLPKGSFSSLAVNTSGLVSINYNNGTSSVIAQIPIVTFFAQNQLQRVTGGAFSANLASGSPQYNDAGNNGSGSIVGGSLEASTVDIATEFTHMIQAQQVYAANAKTITTVNNMLNTIINVIQ